MALCTHKDLIRLTTPPPGRLGCEDCLATGGRWVHLRMCLTCGHIACCDSSPNRHARKHAQDTGHHIARSVEPGENWAYCFVDSALIMPIPEPSDHT